MSKFTDFVNKIWIKCNGNFVKQTTLIGAIILVIGAIIIVAVYFPWFLLLIIGGGVWLYDENHKQKMKAEQEEQRLKISIVYILRLALEGLENHFGLPQIEDKGFQGLRNSKGKQKHSIRKFVLFYTRLPNVTDLEDHRTCEPMRKILNSNILKIVQKLVHETVISIPIYVVDIKVSDGKLALTVVPIIDSDSYKFVEKHLSYTARKAAVGDNDEDGNIKKAGRGELFDDEL